MASDVGDGDVRCCSVDVDVDVFPKLSGGIRVSREEPLERIPLVVLKEENPLRMTTSVAGRANRKSY